MSGRFILSRGAGRVVAFAAMVLALGGTALAADCDVATGAGFDGPILHGLATYGVIGRALLALLIVEAERAGFRQMIGVIAGAQPASVRLHAACGFREVGVEIEVGRKFNRWLDMVLLQKML